MALGASPAFAAKVVWLFGLSGTGKSTLAEALATELRTEGVPVARLDGDDLRRGLCADLGFDAKSRGENLRRAAHVAGLLSDAGLVVVCSFVTPFERDRDVVREILGPRLTQVFVDTSLDECERRDPKGLYRRARAGDLPQFTGISSPFDPPTRPDLVLRTEGSTVDDLIAILRGRLLRGDERP